MIAAVVDPSGAPGASAILARIPGSWSEVVTRNGVVLARDAEANDAIALREPTRLDAAAEARHSGAFIAHDLDHEGAVLLARGSLGGRPLYYARTAEGALIACSRLEPLLAGTERSFPVNAERLASLCAGRSDPRPASTVFRGVHRVEPCTAVRAWSDRTEIRARAREERSPLHGAPAELAEELWARIERAVRRALGDAKSVGVMVGGGVDSSGLLAATIANARGASMKEVTALAIDFDAEGSDRPYLADLAADLGIVPVRVRPRDAARFWDPATFVRDGQPYALSSAPLENAIMCRAKELGVALLLTGIGGDELLAGDLRGFAAEALAGAPIRAVAAALHLRVPWEISRRERIDLLVARPALKGLVPPRLLEVLARRQDRDVLPWAGPVLHETLRSLREQSASDRPPRTASDRFNRLLRWHVYIDASDGRGQWEAATGIVRKDPYADEEILDLVSRVRPFTLSHDDFHRGLFRLALRGRVPTSIRNRLDKSAFEPAFAEVAMAGGGFERFGDLWTPRRLEELGIVRADAFRSAVQSLFERPESTSESGELWSFATQVVACEQFARTAAGAS